MTVFLEKLRPILDAHLPANQYTIASDEEHVGGAGAAVEVDCGELRIKLMHERMFDFDVDVASKDGQTTWYRLLELLVVASGERAERAKVLVGHSMAELEDFVRRFAAHRMDLATLLSPEHLADTELRLAQVREQTRHPVLKDLVGR